MIQGLQRVEWTGVTRELGTEWQLTKGDRSARCVITNHPLGWELRPDVDGELTRSQVFREQTPLLETAGVEGEDARGGMGATACD